MPNAPAALVTWFTLLNFGGAILAAIPVALGIVLGINARRVALGMVIGVIIGGIIQYGVPPSVSGWVVEISQFLAVSLAVGAISALGDPLFQSHD